MQVPQVTKLMMGLRNLSLSSENRSDRLFCLGVFQLLMDKVLVQQVDLPAFILLLKKASCKSALKQSSTNLTWVSAVKLY